MKRILYTEHCTIDHETMIDLAFLNALKGAPRFSASELVARSGKNAVQTTPDVRIFGEIELHLLRAVDPSCN